MSKALLAVLGCCLLAYPADARQERSQAVIRAFKKANPCPVTGQSVGRCPGWQIDHMLALCAGGPDETWNLQWIRIEDHKAKTRQDVAICREDRKKR